MEDKKQVGIWVRVSTDIQGDSPEHHEKRARLYVEAKGWEVKTVYHLEAMSGKSVMGYTETKRMLDDIRSGNITGLVFSKLARLARNTKELLEFADIFKSEDADLISLQESIDTSTPAGRLFYTMIAAMAQWEREEITDRIVASIPIRAKLGKNIGGHPPLGYKWIGEKGFERKFVIDEQFAPVRKLIYELFLKHRRKKAVADILNKQGYRTTNNRLFSDAAIGRLLRDPTAKGERRSNFTYGNDSAKRGLYKPTSEWSVHPCPAIVSEELWNDCNTLLDQIEKKRVKVGPRPKTLLAGYAECAECQKKMYVYHHTKSSSYTCNNCRIRIHVEDLHHIYKEQLKNFLLTDVSVNEFSQKMETDLREKEKLLLAAREERGKIKKRSEEMVNLRLGGEWSREMFMEHIRPIEERLKQIDDLLPELEADIDFLKIQYYSSDTILSNASDLYSSWDTYDFEKKRAIVEIITERILVGKQDIFVKLSYLPTKGPKAAKPAQKDISDQQNPGKSPRLHIPAQ